jgi:hypothetical protein
MTELRSRVQRFIRRPLPRGDRVKGNATIGLIARYAAGGRWDDPVLCRLAAGCASALEKWLPEISGPTRAYYAEAAAILRGILEETAGRRKQNGRGKAGGTG